MEFRFSQPPPPQSSNNQNKPSTSSSIKTSPGTMFLQGQPCPTQNLPRSMFNCPPPPVGTFQRPPHSTQEQTCIRQDSQLAVSMGSGCALSQNRDQTSNIPTRFPSPLSAGTVQGSSFNYHSNVGVGYPGPYPMQPARGHSSVQSETQNKPQFEPCNSSSYDQSFSTRTPGQYFMGSSPNQSPINAPSSMRPESQTFQVDHSTSTLPSIDVVIPGSYSRRSSTNQPRFKEPPVMLSRTSVKPHPEGGVTPGSYSTGSSTNQPRFKEPPAMLPRTSVEHYPEVHSSHCPERYGGVTPGSYSTGSSTNLPRFKEPPAMPPRTSLKPHSEVDSSHSPESYGGVTPGSYSTGLSTNQLRFKEPFAMPPRTSLKLHSEVESSHCPERYGGVTPGSYSTRSSTNQPRFKEPPAMPPQTSLKPHSEIDSSHCPERYGGVTLGSYSTGSSTNQPRFKEPPAMPPLTSLKPHSEVDSSHFPESYGGATPGPYSTGSSTNQPRFKEPPAMPPRTSLKPHSEVDSSHFPESYGGVTPGPYSTGSSTNQPRFKEPPAMPPLTSVKLHPEVHSSHCPESYGGVTPGSYSLAPAIYPPGYMKSPAMLSQTPAESHLEECGSSYPPGSGIVTPAWHQNTVNAIHQTVVRAPTVPPEMQQMAQRTTHSSSSLPSLGVNNSQQYPLAAGSEQSANVMPPNMLHSFSYQSNVENSAPSSYFMKPGPIPPIYMPHTGMQPETYLGSFANPHSFSYLQNTGIDNSGGVWPSNQKPPIEQSDTQLKLVDEMWIRKWLGNRVSCTADKRQNSNTFKVFEIRQYLQTCLQLLRELKKAEEQLKDGLDTLEQPAWQTLLEDVEQKKKQLSMCLSEVSDPALLEGLNQTLAKRRKKRQYQKRRRAIRKEESEISRADRQHLHNSIDAWIEDMQDTVERAKREESLKKEADAVLSNVTRQKAEAQRQIGLLSSLQRLRELRTKMAVSRGEHVSADHSDRFKNVIERLKELWGKQLRDYNLEEKGLRLMLSEAVDERDHTTILKEKRILVKWEKLLFGTLNHNTPDFYLTAERNEDDFVSIRQSWDKFLAPAEAVMSSAIPVGWVLPSNPTSAKWEALLSTENFLD